MIFLPVLFLLLLLLLSCLQVLSVLAKINDWQFDSFELDEVSGGWPLSTLTFAILTKQKLVARR